MMSKKIDDQAPNILGMEGKGPWDAPTPPNSDKPGKAKSGPAPDASGADEGPPKEGPRNPWDPDVADEARAPGRQRGPSLEDLLRRAGAGGGGGNFSGIPRRPNGKSWWPVIIGGFFLLWVAFTSVHRLDQQEEGVVTFFGKYSRTVGSGISFTLPAPFERMQKVDALQVRTTSVGSANANSENLVLTKDQNLMDIAFDIRWSIKSPELYLFQLDDPNGAVQEVGESAMRAELANFDYNEAVGVSRGAIQAQVKQRMQAILDEYRSGISISSVSIRQSDPPEQVKAAFREVNSAQQQRQTDINNARAYASTVTERAAGQTAQFDKIYEQYKQAPEVTRRRLYYETMEQVLSKVDKTIIEPGNVTSYFPLPEARPKALPNEVVVTGKAK